MSIGAGNGYGTWAAIICVTDILCQAFGAGNWYSIGARIINEIDTYVAGIISEIDITCWDNGDGIWYDIVAGLSVYMVSYAEIMEMAIDMILVIDNWY